MKNLYDEPYFMNSKFSNYKNYDERSYSQLALDIEKIAKLKKEDAVFDFGCATGKLLDSLYRLGYENLSGYDISDWAIIHGRSIYPHLKERVFVDILPKKADVITCLDVLEHQSIDELSRTLRKFKEINPRILIIRVPVSALFGDDYVLECSRNDDTHKMRLTKRIWSGLFHEVGFHVTHIIHEKDIYDSDGVFCVVLTNNVSVDASKEYFDGRELELKHFYDSILWKNYFEPRGVLFFGCGRGPRVYAMENIGIPSLGLEIDKYAKEKGYTQSISIVDITKNNWEIEKDRFDLCVAYDVLEHIDYDDIDNAISNIVKCTTKNLLISVPFLGDPNLDADPTHKIKESKEWWLNKFRGAGLNLVPTPDNFQFKEQLMIFKNGK